ncbi:MAG: FkbM family methyltransferase [Methanobrevibacter sp.]|nr:FkbM family methyltransferase [Methanobrevibacter sp.]
MNEIFKNLITMDFSSKTKILKTYINGTKNWPKTTLFLLGLFRKVNWDFKNLGKIELTRKDIDTGVLSFLISVSNDNLTEKQEKTIQSLLFQRNNKIIEINGIKMQNYDLPIIFENFAIEQFHVKKGNGKNVIDIGANRGDTALFFGNKNYNVIGFEPVSELYNSAIKNIELNKSFKEKIIMINKAVSCKNGETKIYINEDLDNRSGDSSQYLDKKGKYELVKTITIEKILKDYNITPYILKIDCEGCEKDVILHSDLSMFKEIYFEYHVPYTNIAPEILIDKLKTQGFKLIEKEETAIPGIGIVKMAK